MTKKMAQLNMSYLSRTGNSRNDIAFTDVIDQTTKYLNRTIMAQLNAIRWFAYDGMSDYANVLKRDGEGRNDLHWEYIQLIDQQKLYLNNFLRFVYQYCMEIAITWGQMNSDYRYDYYYENGDDHFSLGGARLAGWQGDKIGEINANLYLKEEYRNETDFNSFRNELQSKYINSTVIFRKLVLGSNTHENVSLNNITVSSGQYSRIGIRFKPFGIYKTDNGVNVDMYW